MGISNRNSVASGVISRQYDQRQPSSGAAFVARFSGHAHQADGLINRQHSLRAVFMSTIKPIETSYGGHRYRSRLEARWAVFFDRMHMAFEYEPEGFRGDGFMYLPDFYLPSLKTYVEIKPRGGIDIDLLKKCRWFGSQKPLVLIIGGPKDEAIFHFDNRCDMDVDEFIQEERQHCGDRDESAIINSYPWALLHELEWGMEWKTRSLTLITHHTGSLNGALEDAREARFEFGQTPRSPRD